MEVRGSEENGSGMAVHWEGVACLTWHHVGTYAYLGGKVCLCACLVSVWGPAGGHLRVRHAYATVGACRGTRGRVLEHLVFAVC